MRRDLVVVRLCWKTRRESALTSAGAALDAALRGHGLVSCRSYQVAEQFATGQLQRVLTAFEP